MSSTKLIRVRRNLATSRWPMVVAGIILLVVLPGLVYWYTSRQAAATEQVRTSAIAGRIERAFARRLETYAQVLHGADGFLRTVPDASAAAWRSYAGSVVDGPARAMRGLLWAPTTPVERTQELESRMRLRGETAFAVRSTGAHDPRHPIALAFPLELAAAQLGCDLDDDPAAAEAIHRAIATGKLSLSAPLQHASAESTRLLLVQPVADPAGAVSGVVCTPLDLDAMVADVRTAMPEAATIEIIDQTGPQPAILALPQVPARSTGQVVSLTSIVGGRIWALTVRPVLPGFDILTATPWLLVSAAIALGGLALGLLLQLRQRQARVTAMAERMTADLRATQQELRAALVAAQEAASAKDGFLAMMSHELRTPLNGVIGMTNLLLDGELTAEQRDFGETARQCANGLLEVIDDILDYSKLEAGKVTVESSPFDPRDLVEEVLQVVADRAHGKGIELVGEVDPRLGVRLRGDPSRLRQLLLNLVANAIKFTERGEVVVSLRLMRDDLARPTVRLAVRDTGIGISAEQLGRLFTPFTQADGSISRRFGGTGLGLAISKRLAEAMGGMISASSREGVGSEFYADIPLAREEPSDTSAPPAELLGRLAVVIDDHPVVRASVAAILGDIGCDVVAAANAGEAAVLLQDAVPDLAIVDVSGHNDDAAAIAAQLRSARDLGQVPLVLLCRVGTQPHRLVQRASSVNKPVRRRQLRDACVSAIGGRPGSGTARIPRRFPGMHVLIADSRLGNLRILAALLGELGCRCDLAADAVEAAAAAGRVNHAVVLVAHDLPPDGADGVAHELRRRGANGLFISTGGPDRRTAAGCDGWLPSPPRTGDLIRLLARATDNGTQPS